MKLPWRKVPAAAPATPRTIVTHVEHDLAQLNVTPAVIEPSAFFTQMATHNAGLYVGLYVAYLRTGAFTRKQSFEVFCMHLDASFHQGRK
ncbi:hypothetical protein [Pseudarthrobacter sp. S9]|uniref:hypothetical protein n=1 Tax=Pseudarthrobacter sp. S9 TaxID=3418421 RepID=UPI003D052745